MNLGEICVNPDEIHMKLREKYIRFELPDPA
jgi:hypothetical protein